MLSEKTELVKKIFNLVNENPLKPGLHFEPLILVINNDYYYTEITIVIGTEADKFDCKDSDTILKQAQETIDNDFPDAKIKGQSDFMVFLDVEMDEEEILKIGAYKEPDEIFEVVMQDIYFHFVNKKMTVLDIYEETKTGHWERIEIFRKYRAERYQIIFDKEIELYDELYDDNDIEVFMQCVKENMYSICSNFSKIFVLKLLENYYVVNHIFQVLYKGSWMEQKETGFYKSESESVISELEDNHISIYLCGSIKDVKTRVLNMLFTAAMFPSRYPDYIYNQLSELKVRKIESIILESYIQKKYFSQEGGEEEG